MVGHIGKKYFLLTGGLLIALAGLSGCGFKQNPDDTAGGKMSGDSGNHAPKVIRSGQLISFSAKFFLYGENGSEGEAYRFDVRSDDSGQLILSDLLDPDIRCETSEEILTELQNIIVKYELVKLNGTEKHPNGLPAEFQSSVLSAEYESGEQLYFCMDNDPEAAWAKEVLNLLETELAAHGKSRFLSIKGMEGVILKKEPEENDLIKGETFYAQLPKSRYGGNYETGDYAEGEFIIWVNRIELSETGEITARDGIAVPYIVGGDGNEGNEENLSMLSGGWDGDYPYDDEIWKITTNEDGRIVDAVFYQSGQK